MNISNYSCKYFGGNKTLSSYLNDIRKYKVPTIEEEEALFERIAEGDQKAKDEIIKRNQRFVYALAKIYAKSEDDVMDYVDEGNIGLIKAISEFKLDKGYKFITFAVWYIRREMNYFLETTNNPIRRSNNMKLSKKIDSVRQDYFSENGYYPTTEQIIDLIKDKYDIDIKDKSDVFDLDIVSISDTFDDDGYGVEQDEEYNNKTSSVIEYEKNVDDDHNKAVLDELFGQFYKQVREDRENEGKEAINTEVNADIVKMLFGVGYDRAYTVPEVAEKYDMSEEDVIAIKNATIKYMRQERKKYKIAI